MARREPGVTTSEGGAILRLPVRRSAAAIAAGLGLAAFWLTGLVLLPYLAVVTRPPPGGLVFLALGELVLAGIGAYTVYALVWGLVGWETLEVTPDRVVMGYVFLGRHMSRAFDRAAVDDLRVEAVSGAGLLPRTPAGTVGEGVISFDHEGVTYRLGKGLAPAEAERLLSTLLDAGDRQ